MITFHAFETAGQAMAYRMNHGTGGWIFLPDNGNRNGEHFSRTHNVILFPPDMTPSAIMAHPLTGGMSGRLIS